MIKMRFQRLLFGANDVLAALLAICSVLLLISSSVVQVGGVDRQSGARRLGQSSKFKSACGTERDVAARIGICLRPTLGAIYGEKKPANTDAELLEFCDMFDDAGKCIRNVSKECLTGLPKTTASSIASAIKRFRMQECKTPETRARYKGASHCAYKHGKALISVHQNHTALFQAIRDLPSTTPEQKVMKNCCVLNELDKFLIKYYDRVCPESSPALMGTFHAMIDDARNTLCTSPKCNHALDKVIGASYKPPQTLVEPIMEVIFTLVTE